MGPFCGGERQPVCVSLCAYVCVSVTRSRVPIHRLYMVSLFSLSLDRFCCRALFCFYNVVATEERSCGGREAPATTISPVANALLEKEEVPRERKQAEEVDERDSIEPSRGQTSSVQPSPNLQPGLRN